MNSPFSSSGASTLHRETRPCRFGRAVHRYHHHPWLYGRTDKCTHTTDFTETAENIQLEGSRLTAELYTVEGGTRERQGIELNDRIGNDNGQLSVSHCHGPPQRTPRTDVNPSTLVVEPQKGTRRV